MTPQRRLITTALLLSGLPVRAQSANGAALQAAIDGPHRSANNRARDAARHPLETLQFFGLQPDQQVVELQPGGGWYTEILAPYLRTSGRLIAAHDAADDLEAYKRRARQNFDAKLAANPALYDQVQVGLLPRGAQFTDIPPRGGADLVLTFRNIHNWIPAGEAGLKTLFASVYDSLKPGGVFGVVEHRLPAARVQDAEAGSGYVHEAYVIRLAESAGFKLAARSEINANPKDKADHKGGVWALPPTYANKDAERAAYQAIGESDRMTLKFVKP